MRFDAHGAVIGPQSRTFRIHTGPYAGSSSSSYQSSQHWPKNGPRYSCRHRFFFVVVSLDGEWGDFEEAGCFAEEAVGEFFVAGFDE